MTGTRLGNMRCLNPSCGKGAIVHEGRWHGLPNRKCPACGTPNVSFKLLTKKETTEFYETHKEEEK
jgi:hypothetical protein